MKSKFIGAALACLALTLQPALAGQPNGGAASGGGHHDNYLASVGASVSRLGPDGKLVLVSQVTTDAKGQFMLRGLPPGDYVIDIDGKSLAEQIETVIVTAERKAEDSPTVSIGVGGMFGGGSSHSSSSGHPGVPGGGSSHSSSGGGVGLGLSIPIGGGNPDTHPTAPTISISVAVVPQETWVSGVGDDANPCSRTAPCKTFPQATRSRTWVTGVGDLATGVTFSSPYCRDAASQGMRIGFTVPKSPADTAFVGEPRSYGLTLGVHF